MMEHIQHPGTPATERFTALPCHVQEQPLTLRGGQTLHDAIVAAAADAGIDGAFIELSDTPLARLRYVIPGHDPSGERAAWYSATHEMAPPARLLQAGLHLGQRDGEPFLHCHGLWQDRNGTPAMGHLLPQESWLEDDVQVTAWRLDGARLSTAYDAETHFPLFTPTQVEASQVAPNGLLFTLRPNQDLSEAVLAIAAHHGIRQARLSGLGSLVGTTFTDGTRITSHATEVLILDGQLNQGELSIRLASVGINGHHHSATLASGRNSVCVTAELLLHSHNS